MEFPCLELVKTHLRTNHRVTEENCHFAIILPDKHLITEDQVNQFAKNEGVEVEDDEDDDEDDELCVLLEIAPPRFPLKASEEEVEVLEEIPPPSFRRKRKVSDNWRVSLLNKMREMRFLPADQLAVQLRKVKEQKKKKLKEEEFLELFKKAEKRKRRKEEDRNAEEQKMKKKKKKKKEEEFLESFKKSEEQRKRRKD